MVMLYLSAGDLLRALPMAAAVEAMRDGFRALADGTAQPAPRGVLQTDGGTILSMVCAQSGVGIVSKTAAVFPANPARGLPGTQALATLFDPETGTPTVVCDGTALTAIRTGAASGLATDLLAQTDAAVGAVIGCGPQGRTQVLALDCVRELREIRVAARDPARVAAFVEGLRGQVRARLVPCDGADDAVREADVVCAATSSRTPVFDGALLRPGAHVNGIGSFTPEMRELDATTIARARVFVDAVGSAVEEAGELLHAEREGHTTRDAWTELGAVVTGAAQGRRDASEITLFKSVGHAVQDVAALGVAVTRARELGLGTELPQ